MPLTMIVTDAGRAALVNAANTGTNPVTIAQVGLTATAIAPAATATALSGEFKRIGALSGDVVADDTIHLIVRDESTDAFTVRSIGLYLADGTLFAIYGQAGVLIEKSAQALMLLAVDVRFADVSAANLTFGNANFLNPPATTETQGVVELATTAEAQAATDALRALTPAAAKASVLGWLLAQDGSGSGIDADLLDGQHGSYYTNIPARLGYTPANAAGQVFTGDIGRDAAFLMAFAGSNPALFFDNAGGADRIEYDRAANQWSFSISGAPKLRVDASLVEVTGALFKRAGNLVWDAGNDGAGSGLDADLLDGQHGSYYSNIPARLGFTPANAAGQIFTGDIGRDAGFYMTVSGSVSSLVFDTAGGADRVEYDRTANKWDFLISGASKLRVDSAAVEVINGALLKRAGNLVWDAGNDGSGSGLDADLLDGYHASVFDRLTSSNYGNVGYRVLADGFKICWSQVAVPANSTVAVTLPITFGIAPRIIVGSASRANYADQDNSGLLSGSETTTGFSVVNGFEFAATFSWFAIGS